MNWGILHIIAIIIMTRRNVRLNHNTTHHYHLSEISLIFPSPSVYLTRSVPGVVSASIKDVLISVISSPSLLSTSPPRITVTIIFTINTCITLPPPIGRRVRCQTSQFNLASRGGRAGGRAVAPTRVPSADLEYNLAFARPLGEPICRVYCLLI